MSVPTRFKLPVSGLDGINIDEWFYPFMVDCQTCKGTGKLFTGEVWAGCAECNDEHQKRNPALEWRWSCVVLVGASYRYNGFGCTADDPHIHISGEDMGSSELRCLWVAVGVKGDNE